MRSLIALMLLIGSGWGSYAHAFGEDFIRDTLAKQRKAVKAAGTESAATGSATDLATTGTTGYVVYGDINLISPETCAWIGNGCLIAIYNVAAFKYNGINYPEGSLVAYVAIKDVDAYSIAVPMPGRYVVVGGFILWEGMTCQYPELGTAAVNVTGAGKFRADIETRAVAGVDGDKYRYTFSYDSSGGTGMDLDYTLCMPGKNNPCYEHSHQIKRDVNSGVTETNLRTLLVSTADATAKVVNNAYSDTTTRMVGNKNPNYAIFRYSGRSAELKEYVWITVDVATGVSRIDYMFWPVCIEAPFFDCDATLIGGGQDGSYDTMCPPLAKKATLGAS
ncbi:MAG: hypothetical protein HYV63_22520 [Candidatus Schekmanbacteria bacterium]|nr:hypothetical protein [Candidatus Schekmanbacteria bacterium]